MVCKEEVLLWFKDLDSYRRIDVLYELLTMCLPFELRFIGSCIEELGKHTYAELRGPAITANDLEKLTKDASFNQGILDDGVRHRLLIYLSLLSSRNFSVASWIYRKLLRTDSIEEYVVREKGKDEVLHGEFLLLFTMALHHPAFTFEHKQFFSRILTGLIDIRENRISAKHSALGYPPGFGYPTVKSPEPFTVPVKSASTPCGDSQSTAFQQLLGLPHLPPPTPLDFITPMWNRPGFPCGAPEVPPFPASSMSPLVSEATSPSQSRSNSPLRVPLTRPPPKPPAAPTLLQSPSVPPPPQPAVVPLNGPPPPPPVDGSILPLPTAPPLPPPGALTAAATLEQLSQSSLPSPPPPPPAVYAVTSTVLPPPPDMTLVEEDATKLAFEEKQLRDILWPHPSHMSSSSSSDVKQPNGICFNPFLNKVRPYLVDQMQALNVLDPPSNSSGNSSPGDESPPPPVAAAGGSGAATPKQLRANGMPQFGQQQLQMPPDTTSPPPPPPTFGGNSSVPYSFSQPFSLPPNNRSMFPYNQGPYRPTNFAAAGGGHYQNYPTENSFSYPLPYVQLMYSSPFPARTQPGCYNCGAPGHVGSECTGQNIEEITRKKTFQLEYTSPLPDSDK